MEPLTTQKYNNKTGFFSILWGKKLHYYFV